jgi:hypothetical protein
MGLRMDLIFSYWIIVWYILYILKIVTVTPKLLLLLGIIENLIMLFLMFYFHTKWITIIEFIIINIFLKIIPFYTVVNDIITLKTIKVSGGVFIVYIFWLLINNESIISYYKKVSSSLINNKSQTPAMRLLNKYFKFIK